MVSLNIGQLCCILRKTIERYQSSFDYITLERIISKQNTFVSDRNTEMQSRKMKQWHIWVVDYIKFERIIYNQIRLYLIEIPKCNPEK